MQEGRGDPNGQEPARCGDSVREPKVVLEEMMEGPLGREEAAQGAARRDREGGRGGGIRGSRLGRKSPSRGGGLEKVRVWC